MADNKRAIAPRTLFESVTINGNPRNGPSNRRSLSTSTSSLSSTGSLSDLPTPTTPLSPGEESASHAISTAMNCSQCMREGAPLFCFSCGFWVAKGRVAKQCDKHPKVIFYTDFADCPKCKKPGALHELD